MRQQLNPEPVRPGPSIVTIELADAAENPISHARVQVEAEMSHPGMSPVFGDAKETVSGRYQAHIDFNMGGDWVVLLHIQLPDGRKIERQTDVRGVRSN